jgi:secondary thiamine-phosphate synthase enzyme
MGEGRKRPSPRQILSGVPERGGLAAGRQNQFSIKWVSHEDFRAGPASRRAAMNDLSKVRLTHAPTMASAHLAVQTSGVGFFEITRDVARFLESVEARDGVVLLFLRHTSASLVIQENADADVRADLATALDRLAPANAGWIHDTEGADDMPAHIKSMLDGVCLHVPVSGGRMALGTWQGIYVAEHRQQPHRREVVLQFLGTRGQD